MFIKSSADVVLKYYKGANCIEIKPNTVTFVDNGLITEKELKDCYGTRVHILPEEDANSALGEALAEEVAVEDAPVEEVKEEKVEEAKEEKVEEAPKEVKEEVKATKKDNKKNNKK